MRIGHGYDVHRLVENRKLIIGGEEIPYELGLLGGQYSYSTAIGLFNTVVNVVMLLIVNTICKRLSDVSLW